MREPQTADSAQHERADRLHPDSKFVVNGAGQTLADRFAQLIGDDACQFDCMVGYFYSSGFHLVRSPLEQVDRIRILVGIQAKLSRGANHELKLSSTARQIESVCAKIRSEYASVREEPLVEDSSRTFVDWLRSGKIEIRMYPGSRLHAKLYVITYGEQDRDVGRVVTGSSNFSKAGLRDNLEINVELKDRGDYDFALAKFEELWDDAVPIDEEYEGTLAGDTWLRDDISPYQMWLKFLYEYFRGELNIGRDTEYSAPEGMLQLEYQDQAVRQALQIIRQYGGVFLADVVGLGKTYMAARVARDWRAEKGGGILVVAPPKLISEKSRSLKGSWREVLAKIGVDAWYQSSGNIGALFEDDLSSVSIVIIDESHNFRSDSTQAYTHLRNLCHGRTVILVSATPYNNRPADIQSQIKLFQLGTNSSIPGLKNLDGFFRKLDARFKGITRKTHPTEYRDISEQNAREVREGVMRYVTVRRLRSEIVKYYATDLKEQGITFPMVEKPHPLLYELDAKLERIFDVTIDLLKSMSYARYSPLLYYERELPEQGRNAQLNLIGLMRILLVKRLESSFAAFRATAESALMIHKSFLEQVEAGKVWVATDDQSAKLRQALLDGDEDALNGLLEREQVSALPIDDFSRKFVQNLRADIDRFEEIVEMWKGIQVDPKLDSFLAALQDDPVLRDGRPIIFTEATTTAKYLEHQIKIRTNRAALVSHGAQNQSGRDQMLANFDANHRRPMTDFDLLVTTDVNAEGINLHASNVVVNYDLPWNPTRMIQRVGRINRVGTKHARIHTYNFFPSREGDSELGLESLAVSKIAAFLELLGNDARLLTDDEDISPRKLFEVLNSEAAASGEGDDDANLSELQFLEEIKEVRERDPKLFAEIEAMPKRARSFRIANDKSVDGLVTFFRAEAKDQRSTTDVRPALTHIVYSRFETNGEITSERLGIHAAAKLLWAEPSTLQANVSSASRSAFYKLYAANCEEMKNYQVEQVTASIAPKLPNSTAKLLKFVMLVQKEEGVVNRDRVRLETLEKRVRANALPKQVVVDILKAIREKTNLSEVVRQLMSQTPQTYLEEKYLAGQYVSYSEPEVVLSSYALGRQNESGEVE